METAKLKLLKPNQGKKAGDVIEVRRMEARVLKAIGVAEDHVESAVRTARTTTRVMKPETTTSEQQPPQPTIESESEPKTEEAAPTSRTPYSRRDMKPEE